MTPVITKPTRITDHTITLIYHIYTNASISQIISGIALFDISDHLPVFCAINTPIKQSQERNYFRDYKSFNRELYLNDVRQLNWNAMTDASEVAKSTENVIKGPITWNTFNPVVELSPIDRVKISVLPVTQNSIKIKRAITWQNFSLG
jgi:hypothetical protein